MTFGQPGTIVRTWTGEIRRADRVAYASYLEETGLGEYRATQGNLGAWAMYRDVAEDRTEVVTVSLWESLESIVAFAGDPIENAVFYPADDEFLVARDTTVRHYEIVG